MQLALGLPDPREQSSLPILKRVQAGISRARVGHSETQVRLPITPSLLHQIRVNLDSSSRADKALLWAVCCIAFFGCFQLGELLLESTVGVDQCRHLSWGDVSVDSQTNPRMLQVHLKQYKTDQFGKGADIVLGKTGNELCPVAAALGYMAVRGDQPGPFFIDADSRPLRKAQFVTELCAISLLWAGHRSNLRAIAST